MTRSISPLELVKGYLSTPYLRPSLRDLPRLPKLHAPRVCAPLDPLSPHTVDMDLVRSLAKDDEAFVIDLFNRKGAYLWAFGLNPPPQSISTGSLRQMYRRVVGPPPRRPCRLTTQQVDALLAAGVLRRPAPRELATAFVGLFPVLKKNGMSRVVGDEALRSRISNRYPVGVMGPQDIARFATVFDRGIVSDARHYFYQLPIDRSLGPLFAVSTQRGTLFMTKALQGNRLVPAYAQAVARVIMREAASEFVSVGAAAIYDDWLLATTDSVSTRVMAARMERVAERFGVGLKETRDAEGSVVAGCQISFVNRTIRPDPAFLDKFLELVEKSSMDRHMTALQLWCLAGSALWTLTAYLLPACYISGLIECLSCVAMCMSETGRGWHDTFPVTQAAKDCIAWAASLAEQRPHRALHRLSPRSTVLAATDASTTAVAIVTEGWIYSAPIEISSRRIFVAEALTAISAVRALASSCPHTTILLFVDNEGARLALTKMHSSVREVAGALRDLYEVLCKRGTDLRVRYVPTGDNPADVPTRVPWPTDRQVGPIAWASLPSDLQRLLKSRPSLRDLGRREGEA